jgi:DNA-directed RNA polymerase specialized sigma24 family protein
MAAGDFAAFYARAYPDAKRLAHLLLDGSPSADDVVQVAFTDLHDVYSEVVDPEAHLRSVLVDRCARREHGDRRPAAAGIGGAAVELSDPLLDAVGDLPPRERAAVVLRYWAGLADLDVAAATGTSPSQVRASIRWGLDRLHAGRAAPGDLERDLRDALSFEARTVPLPDAEWAGPRAPHDVPVRRHGGALAAAVVLIGALVVGVAVAWPRPALEGGMRSDPERSVLVVGPDGLLPLVDPRNLDWAPVPYAVGPINPASFRVWQGATAQFVTYQTIETRPGARVLEVWCVEWQYREPTCYPRTSTLGLPLYDSLDDSDNRTVQTVASTRALQCLAAAGLDSDPRHPVPDGVDVGGVWRRCVGEARAGAKQTFQALGGRVVTDRVDDPSIVTAD